MKRDQGHEPPKLGKSSALFLSWSLFPSPIPGRLAARLAARLPGRSLCVCAGSRSWSLEKRGTGRGHRDRDRCLKRPVKD